MSETVCVLVADTEGWLPFLLPPSTSNFTSHCLINDIFFLNYIYLQYRVVSTMENENWFASRHRRQTQKHVYIPFVSLSSLPGLSPMQQRRAADIPLGQREVLSLTFSFFWDVAGIRPRALLSSPGTLGWLGKLLCCTQVCLWGTSSSAIFSLKVVSVHRVKVIHQSLAQSECYVIVRNTTREIITFLALLFNAY